MSVPLLTTASQVMCPHGGTVKLTTANQSAKAGGSPVLLVSDQHAVSGCAFQLPTTPPTPSPCVIVRWSVGALQTKINGTAVLNQSSVGLCYAATQAPQGPPIVSQTQSQAKGL